MAEQSGRIATVSQLTTYVKSLIDGNHVLQGLWVRGEISNFKPHYSGHMYMTLKDEGAVIRAVMFKGANSRLRFRPENGMKVLAGGRVSVYERDGQYQLYIEDMRPDGVGDLHIAFEQLKKRLGDEGLFDPGKKRPLPQYPTRIGVITSGTGAAIRDILNILSRRYKNADVYVYPVLVQGEKAAASIAEAIEYFNQDRAADLLIVGRGGGSIEDLWAFNEEVTVRAVAASVIPVISAVGHETDFTICDFVADLRAPTPSAAAELATPAGLEVHKYVTELERRAHRSVSGMLDLKRERLKRLRTASCLVNFTARLDAAVQNVDQLVSLAYKTMRFYLSAHSERLAAAGGRLDALSPLAVLGRGYSIAAKQDGRVIKSVKQVADGEEIQVRVADGALSCTVRNREAGNGEN